MARKKHSMTSQIPQSREAAEADMRALGKLRIQIAEIDNQLKEDSQALIQKAKDNAEPIEAKIKTLQAGLELYAAAHREELTDGNKSKTGKMLSGHFDWRKLPESVSLSGVADIISRIELLISKHTRSSEDVTLTDYERKTAGEKASKFSGFLRRKTTVNKDAMLADPDLARSVKGVKIESKGERLEIVVYENSLED